MVALREMKCIYLRHQIRRRWSLGLRNGHSAFFIRFDIGRHFPERGRVCYTHQLQFRGLDAFRYSMIAAASPQVEVQGWLALVGVS